MTDYHGHITLADGSHVALSEAEAKSLWDSAMNAKAWRELVMPEVPDALRQMIDAFQRLKELGWHEAIYCPKDGSHFEAVEAGSTGTFDCWYDGEWPKGSWWCADGGDIWPSRPTLFRLYPADQAARDARMNEARRKYHAEQLPAEHS